MFPAESLDVHEQDSKATLHDPTQLTENQWLLIADLLKRTSAGGRPLC
ncbi:MAG: hypothetical protein R3B91_13940 [Planctomycetaceae bacterium]